MTAEATVQGFSMGSHCRQWVWRSVLALLRMRILGPKSDATLCALNSPHHTAYNARSHVGTGEQQKSYIRGVGLQFAGWVSPGVGFMTVSSPWLGAPTSATGGRGSCLCGQDWARSGVAYLGALGVTWGLQCWFQSWRRTGWQ
jgi:hypothetical protein